MMLFRESISIQKAKYLYSLPNEIIKSEMYDSEELDENGKKWDADIYIKSIKKFLKRVIVEKGILKQKYKYSNRLKNKGRKYICGFGVQSLQHKLRGFLVSDYYTDYDMSNCHPTILNYIVKKEFSDTEFPGLDKYVKKRDKLLKTYNANKKTILISMNSDKKTGSDNTLIKGLDKEFKQIQDLLWNSSLYPEYKDESKKNKKGSFLNTVCCIYEGQILDKAISHLGDAVAVPMFDGFLIDSSLNSDAVLSDLNDITKEYNITWTTKAHNDEIELDEDIILEEEMLMDYDIAKVNFEERFFIVSYPLAFCREIDNDLRIYNRADFSALVECEQFTEIDKKGDAIEKSIFPKWLKDKTRRHYERLDFIPSYDFYSDKIYNTFRGFDFKGDKMLNIEGVNVFLDHLRLLVNYDEDSFKYLVSYIADMFQNTDTLPETALLFKSGQGVGKDLMIDYIQKMLGQSYVYRTAKLDEIFDKFNGSLKNKIVLQLNEIQGSDGFAKKENLKDLITAKDVNINEKNLKPYTLSNYMRIFIFSNNLTPIEIPHDDRRYCVFECGKKKDRAYYNKLVHNMKNPDIIESLVNYFKSYDISNFDIKDRPITKAYKTMQESNIHPLYEYLYQTFGDNGDGDYDEMFMDDFQVHKKTGDILIKPTDFREGFKMFLQGREQTYIKHDFKTLKILLESLDILSRDFKIKKSVTTYYIFDISAIFKNIVDKGFVAPEIEILE